MDSRDISECVYQILKDAPPAKLLALQRLLENFRDQYGRSYREVRQQPFADNIITALFEAVYEGERRCRVTQSS